MIRLPIGRVFDDKVASANWQSLSSTRCVRIFDVRWMMSLLGLLRLLEPQVHFQRVLQLKLWQCSCPNPSGTALRLGGGAMFPAV